MGVGAGTQAVNRLTAQDNGFPDRTAPTGIFDSGVGGLTVAHAIMDQLPHESIIYIGDAANGPYGPLRIAEVRQHIEAIADELVTHGYRMIVIACNTTSATFLRNAHERHPVPVIEVTLPVMHRTVPTTRSGKVGIVDTAATARSHIYQGLFDAVPGMGIPAVGCPRFMDFVERGITSDRQILGLVENYLAPLQAGGVDTPMLGCIHYPLLSGMIQPAMEEDVALISSAEKASKDVLRILTRTDMLANPKSNPNPVHTLESTGNPQVFASPAERFLGPGISRATMYSQI